MEKTRFLFFLSAFFLLALFYSIGCIQESEKASLTVAGSTTVQPIITRASEVYEKKTGVKVGVQGGGSGTGIRMVAEGSVDIGASSRELKEEERREHPYLQTIPIAIDCIVIVTHPSNPINDLTIEQIRDIFAGKIRNFKEVGGEDKEIVVVMREDGSGTRATFEELIMGKEEVSDANLQKPASGAVRFTVAGNENAIGYLGIGYIDDSVKVVRINGVEPTKENIRLGLYPISRRLYLITKGNSSTETRRFLDFILSDDGQRIVEEEGFISIG